jgi:phosphatidylserine decarboxylase
VDILDKMVTSPCRDSLRYLVTQYVDDERTRNALVEVNKNFHELPVGYCDGTDPCSNPWKSKNATLLVIKMLGEFTKWCTFLPDINGSHDNGLYYIQDFAWFYYRNQAGQDFVQGRDPNNPSSKLLTGLKFTTDFSVQRGEFMWSKASAEKVPEWVYDPRIEISDYQLNPDNTYQYRSFNEFFARQIKTDPTTQTIPSRPATMPLSEYPERDYIVVSPTDCIMNPLVQVLKNEDGSVTREYIQNPLQENMVLDVKNIPISLKDLLGTASDEMKQKFVDGTGLSCVLMPNTYHHFHSPVNGTVKHAEIVKTGLYGYEDFPNWVPLDGNVGRPGSDFSQFQMFQRGVIIVEVKYKDLDGKTLTGYVASIPVGLNTIGSVVLADDIVPGKEVKRGYTRFGNFYYGGSLNILLFSAGLASGVVQTRLGAQITLFNVGTPPADPNRPTVRKFPIKGVTAK